MVRCASKVAVAVVSALLLSTTGYGNNRWEVTETFSTTDGSVQFLVLEFSTFEGIAPQIPTLAGQVLIAGDGKTEHALTFSSITVHYFSNYGFDQGPCGGTGNEDFCSAHVLVATQSFANLGVVTPDFVVPDGFLFVADGSVRLGASDIRYMGLPGPPFGRVAVNNLGKSYAFNKFDDMPEGINPVIEYYNVALDDYFLTAYATEVQKLDAGIPPGWQRTGRSLPAWTSTFAPGATPKTALDTACRVWVHNSHFYSILPDECLQAARQPGAYFESWTAFLASLPDRGTGICAMDETPAYRLWNPQGANHRYTVEAAVRDGMVAQGWVAEGYGPNNVTMCLGGMR